jgi:lysozyme family protein
MNFDEALKILLPIEGGYVNDPKDKGGETNYGITKAVADKHGYKGSMKDIPLTVVQEIYLKQYWVPIRGDDLPSQIQYAVFDAAVNSGVFQSVRWLQRVIGVKEDGILGPVTLGAVKTHDPEKLLRAIVARRIVFLTKLDGWKVFGQGWMVRISKILEEV